jgi:SAM-dependent methyltransferase
MSPVLISARSFAEYLAMFDLATPDLADRTVIDVAAGGSDFAVTAAGFGAHVVAVDAAYAVEPDVLSAQLTDYTGTGLAIVDGHPDRFTWDWYGSRAARDEMRRQAAQRFTIDRLESPGRYVAGALPSLPFRDDAFDLVLCSHLLFTWSEVLDRSWHHDAILELARIGGEVRLFPLVVQATGDPVDWLPSLCDELRGAGLGIEERQVPYEFQTGANRMLVIS